ncbi:MAG: hypothetical protein JST54_06095 [Deltaproteobacteria bacterium]|nr:hypothetical protein [Deltaproteobacteria bacterium]
MQPARQELLGLTARGSDDRRVGRIIRCDDDYFTVEAGVIFPRDTFIPYDEVKRVEEGTAHLHESAAYYRAGGDVDDGHWDAEKAHRARAILGGPEQAHEVGLTPGSSTRGIP